MLTIQRLGRRFHLGCFASVLAFGLAMSGTGTLTATEVTAQAPQPSGPCALLTSDEVQSLAPEETVSEAVASSIDGMGFTRCRYTWGSGVNRKTLDVTVNDAARMFAGAGPDAIKLGLNATVIPESPDEVIADVGEAAVFKAESAFYARATAYIKGRILQIHLDGVDAAARKSEVVALLKSAVSRL
jgi:hypothetical protein